MTTKQLAISVLVLGGLLVVLGAVQAVVPRLSPQETLVTYTDDALALAFTYRAGPEGYRVQEVRAPSDASTEVGTLVLVPASEGADSAFAGEGPARITISVYDNTKREWSGQWAQTHARESGLALMWGEVEDMVVGGATAVRFSADGLYAADVVVVAHGGYVYVLRGEYADQAAPSRGDYEQLVRSLRFVEQG